MKPESLKKTGKIVKLLHTCVFRNNCILLKKVLRQSTLRLTEICLLTHKRQMEANSTKNGQSRQCSSKIGVLIHLFQVITVFINFLVETSYIVAKSNIMSEKLS